MGFKFVFRSVYDNVRLLQVCLIFNIVVMHLMEYNYRDESSLIML